MVLAVLVSGAWAQCDAGRPGVVINEFLANAAGTDSGFEWVEIKNGSAAPLDLSGWLMLNDTSPPFGGGDAIPDGTQIPAGGYLVIGQTLLPDVVDVVVDWSDFGNAGTSSDAIQLQDCFGEPVDTIVYGDPNADLWTDDSGAVATSTAPAPPDGRTLGRDPDGADTDASGADIVVLPYVTPGRANDGPPDTCGGPESGIKVNEIFANPEGADGDVGLEWVELFHAGSAPVDLTGWSLGMGTSSLPTRYTWKTGTMAPGDRILIGEANVPGAQITVASLQAGSGSNADAVVLFDCLGFAADTVVYGSPNDDEWLDDSGEIATSLGPVPGEGASLQRVTDGYDTDLCGVDFAVQLEPSPGAPNPEVEPVVCAPSDGSIRINEFLSDPDGTDEGLEWIELHNGSGAPVSVAGWGLALGTSDFESKDVVLGGGVEIPAGGFLVIGGEDVEEAQVIADFSIGNGTETDGIRLFDCADAAVDTVLYGDTPNASLLPDDRGEIVEPYGDPGSEEALARVADGVDTDTAEDWKVVGITTPGASNVRDIGTIDDPFADGPRSCGCGGGGPPEPGSGQAPSDPGGGCSTSPLPPGAPALLVAGLLALRRRR